MVDCKLEKELTLKDLEVGKIFNELELIVDFDGRTMTTITREEGIELNKGHYEEYDMRTYMYDEIRVKGDGRVISINCNGWGEIFLSDEDHDECKYKLEAIGLW
jgi:hypothetical protein